MGKIQKYWNSAKKSVSHVLFGPMALTIPDLGKYMGKKIFAQKNFDAPFEEIVIEDVRGCIGLGDLPQVERMRLMQTYQINGTHFCSILEFHCQLDEGRRPTADEIADLALITEDIQVREIKGKK